MTADSIGIIAGQGRVPFMVAQGARRAGLRVVCVGLKDQADPALAEFVDRFYWVGLTRPGQWIRYLRREGVHRAILIGAVSKRQIYTPWRLWQLRPDWRGVRLWYGRLRNNDKRTDSVLSALADELATGGVILEDSVQYCREHLAHEGVMTRSAPGESVMRDVRFGWAIAKRMGDLDIGQSIAVKDQEVICVEAIEGTDEMIQRAGQLCPHGGWTLIKVAKPKQDMRFDVPTIGPDTIENLKKNGGKCIAIEANKTVIVDLPQTIQLANKMKIAVVGHPDKDGK